MYVEENGSATGPTLVLLHGGGVGTWSWGPVVARLQENYHLLVPELPGHAHSAGWARFSMRDAAAGVAELIRKRARDARAHVAGLSLGAQTAIQLLALAPEVVESTFVSGTLALKLPGTSLVRPTLVLYRPFQNLSFMVRANMWGLDIPKEYLPQFREDTRRATVDSLTAIFVENMAFVPPAGLDRAGARVLLTVGQKEFGIMRSSARRLARAMPAARAYTVTGVGHNWPLTAPALYARTVRAWIAGSALPPELVELPSS